VVQRLPLGGTRLGTARNRAIAVDIRAHCTGKGCGVEDAPRWLDAATLAPIDPATAPEAQASCGTAIDAVGAVGDRIFRSRFYNRYLVFSNLLVSDAAGAPVTLRDGLSIDFVNAHTGQGYLPDGTVLDLATLTPVGRWPAACVMSYDAAQGRLFARREGNLYVIAEAGRGAARTGNAAQRNIARRLDHRHQGVARLCRRRHAAG
jgi:hypothetical protein